MSEIKESFKGYKICPPKYLENKNGIWYFRWNESYNEVFLGKYSYVKHESSILINEKEDIYYFRIEHLEPNYNLNNILWNKYNSYKEFLEYGKNGEYDKQIEILKYYPEFGDVSTIADRESEFKSIECYYKFVDEKDLKEIILANNYESLIKSISNTLESIYKKDNYYFDWSGLPNDWGSIKYDYESEEFKELFYTWFPKEY